MGPEYEIRVGHCLEVLRDLPDGLVDCCVTSPPYWGLRDYGDPGRNWPAVRYRPLPGLDHEVEVPAGRAALGLERDPHEYVAHLVAVFREVRRVLSPSGTLWLNLGDASAESGLGGTGTRWRASRPPPPNKYSDPWDNRASPSRRRTRGWDRKDLVAVSWLVPLALQADGWVLRSEVIWHKLNPVPESVRDRPTRAHERVLLLAPSGRYRYDRDAIREPHADPRPSKNGRGGKSAMRGQAYTRPRGNLESETRYYDPRGRNARSVWSLAGARYGGAHFAVMPDELARRCVLAGCPAGGLVLDPFCGAGTTGLAAIASRRRFLGIEQNGAYAELARGRLTGGSPPDPKSKRRRGPCTQRQLVLPGV